MKYPVYVISKGRHDCCKTANFLVEDKADFKIVVEPQEKKLYADRYGTERLLILPFSNLGLGGIPARNWVWEHAKAEGHFRHWILDDNIARVFRRYKAQKIPCNSNIAFDACEDFVDRYENIAIAGLQYHFFVPDGKKSKPFVRNCHVYSFLLIRNDLPHRWRGRYNEDTDLCLQVLSDKWCTILFNAFVCAKAPTMTMKGGNSDQLYKGDGRLVMAKSLERMWPGVVETKRRFNRPQHVITHAWKKFDTPLIRRTDIDWDNLNADKYNMKLTQVKAEVKNSKLRELLRK